MPKQQQAVLGHQGLQRWRVFVFQLHLVLQAANPHQQEPQQEVFDQPAFVESHLQQHQHQRQHQQEPQQVPQQLYSQHDQQQLEFLPPQEMQQAMHQQEPHMMYDEDQPMTPPPNSVEMSPEASQVVESVVAPWFADLNEMSDEAFAEISNYREDELLHLWSSDFRGNGDTHHQRIWKTPGGQTKQDLLNIKENMIMVCCLPCLPIAAVLSNPACPRPPTAAFSGPPSTSANPPKTAGSMPSSSS
eukprot:m.61393 g.61393  ORF g.61393 m.61393 type:complete len:245 (+) comp7336_c0_seq1:373-1107(+)